MENSETQNLAQEMGNSSLEVENLQEIGNSSLEMENLPEIDIDQLKQEIDIDQLKQEMENSSLEVENLTEIDIDQLKTIEDQKNNFFLYKVGGVLLFMVVVGAVVFLLPGQSKNVTKLLGVRGGKTYSLKDFKNIPVEGVQKEVIKGFKTFDYRPKKWVSSKPTNFKKVLNVPKSLPNFVGNEKLPVILNVPKLKEVIFLRPKLMDKRRILDTTGKVVETAKIVRKVTKPVSGFVRDTILISFYPSVYLLVKGFLNMKNNIHLGTVAKQTSKLTRFRGGFVNPFDVIRNAKRLKMVWDLLAGDKTPTQPKPESKPDPNPDSTRTSGNGTVNINGLNHILPFFMGLINANPTVGVAVIALLTYGLVNRQEKPRTFFTPYPISPGQEPVINGWARTAKDLWPGRKKTTISPYILGVLFFFVVGFVFLHRRTILAFVLNTNDLRSDTINRTFQVIDTFQRAFAKQLSDIMSLNEETARASRKKVDDFMARDEKVLSQQEQEIKSLREKVEDLVTNNHQKDINSVKDEQVIATCRSTNNYYLNFVQTCSYIKETYQKLKDSLTPAQLMELQKNPEIGGFISDSNSLHAKLPTITVFPNEFVSTKEIDGQKALPLGGEDTKSGKSK